MNSAKASFLNLSQQSLTWSPVKLALLIFILALLLRLINLSWPPFYTGIEEIHVPSSLTYVKSGHFYPDNDYSSPFRKILQSLPLKLLGDVATARRVENAIFGALAAFLLTLIGQQIFPNQRVGILAGLFLATDPLHLSFSRTTWEDIPATFFILAGIYFFTQSLSSSSPNRFLLSLLFSGIFLALALATRRYAILILLAVIIFLFYQELKGLISDGGKEKSLRLIFYVAVFVLVPSAVYLLTFYPWFNRGFSLLEWFSFQKYMVAKELAGISPKLSGFAALYGHSYRAYDWFLRPIIFGFQMPVGEKTTSTFMIINNPFSWLLIWPSFIFLAYQWFKRGRQRELALVLVGFTLLYFPFLMTKRQILIYSSLPVLPLAFLMLAAAIELFKAYGHSIPKPLGTLLVVIIITTNLLFYPLAIGKELSNSFVKFIPFKSYLMQPDPQWLKGSR